MLVTILGSRGPLLFGALACAGSAAALLVVPIQAHGDHVLLIVCLGINGLLANAVQTSMYALAAHVYPTSVRATGVAYAATIGRLGGLLSFAVRCVRHSVWSQDLLVCIGDRDGVRFRRPGLGAQPLPGNSETRTGCCRCFDELAAQRRRARITSETRRGGWTNVTNLSEMKIPISRYTVLRCHRDPHR